VVGALLLLVALVWLLLLFFGFARLAKRRSALAAHPALAAVGQLPRALALLSDVPRRLARLRPKLARIASESAAIAFAYARVAGTFRVLSDAWRDLLRWAPSRGGSTEGR